MFYCRQHFFQTGVWTGVSVDRRRALTYYSEVKSSLPHAVTVPDLYGVAAAMFLLAVCYSQLTAGVCALNADVACPIFNLSRKN